jgi:hypothetical protein
VRCRAEEASCFASIFPDVSFPLDPRAVDDIYIYICTFLCLQYAVLEYILGGRDLEHPPSAAARSSDH